MDVRFRSLEKWPGKLLNKRSPFKSNYSKTLSKLDDELRRVRATDVVIEAGIRSNDIRIDGWPRSNVKFIHPGIVVYFRKGTSKDVLRMPCGTYSSYDANLHAIALTLESLRAIDRYGVTTGNEQYSGFKQLPAADTDPVLAAGRTIERLSKGLASAEMIISSREHLNEAFRRAAQRCHPDVNGGNRNDWDQLEAAKAIIDEHLRAKGL